jgi:ubiquinone/menaquinone biosynthesis C-methylase UbiE
MDNIKKAHEFHEELRLVSLNEDQSTYEGVVKQYFHESAPIYDEADLNPFWKLSNQLIYDLVDNWVINPSNGQGKRYMDAGGGTGFLAFHILDTDPSAKVTIFDLSKDMLKQASQKREERGLEDRLELVNGNLTDMVNISSSTFDGVVSSYNVFGFIYDSKAAISEIARVTRKDSPILLSGIPNKYHGIFFNQQVGRFDEAMRIAKESKGTFTEFMPDINFFTPEELHRLYVNEGLTPELITGTPIFSFPSYEDTDARLISEKTKRLNNSEVWNKEYILEKLFLEKKPIDNIHEHAVRGNTLAIVGYRV